MHIHYRYFLFMLSVIMMSCVSHDINKTIDCASSNLTVKLDSIVNASSCAQADGKLYASPEGGSKPFLFSLNNGTYQSDSSFANLLPGIYTVALRDNNGCETTLDNIQIAASNFQFSATIQGDTECVNHNGSVALTIKEGSAPFQYKLNNGLFSDNNVFTSLAPGTYAITVKDNTSCAVQLNVVIPKEHTNTSWSTDILPIIKTSCAVSGCHDGKTRTDYRIYANAKSQAASIKSQTKDRSMPFDGTPLPQSQIDLIGCWVDDGALNN